MRAKLTVALVAFGVIAVLALSSSEVWVGSWQSTTGTVTHADFQYERPGGKLAAGGYRPYLSYTYSVNAIAHQARSASPDFFEDSQLESARQRYRTGSVVTVYYAANRPEVSVLDQNRPPGNRLAGVFSAMVATTSAVILGAILFRDRKRRRPQSRAWRKRP
jgi:Protein of unknown function (DUF3592)